MSVMGFNPMDDRGTPPFASFDNLGAGLRDLTRNEILGTPIQEVVFDYTRCMKDFWPRRRRSEP
jgi:hypothetical protein